LNHDSYLDIYLRDILAGVRTIAVVGASPRRERPSHGVMAYLQRRGYRTIPVNPNAEGGIINGERCYASLAEVPDPRSSGCSSGCATTTQPLAPKWPVSRS
jgi:predicted CoA-binding protein